jgi:hypothetical protein
MGRNRRWRDLGPGARVAVVLGTAAEITLTSVAAADLARRPPAYVRGPKPLWAAALLVQPVGPVAYLLLGRRLD